jgi:predicted RND superfamily exporter protein
MTVASMGAAAMIMGLGIDFGIHLISIFNEFRQQGKSIKKSIELTVEKDIRAIVGTSITTIAGFMSLWFSSLPAMADLGTILLIGIFYSMVAALIGMMPLLYFYERRKERKISHN